MCYRIVKMCYHLHFSIGINKVLLPSSLQNSRLTYGQENNHNKYCMYNHGYLYIEPYLLAHGCTRWAYLLDVLVVNYKLKFKNIIYGNASSLNWYGNARLGHDNSHVKIYTLDLFYYNQVLCFNQHI